MSENFVQALANVLVNEQKVFTASTLATRFANVESTHRYDTVVRNMGAVFAKMAGENPMRVVSASDVEALYVHLQGLNPNSSFRQDFVDILPPVDNIKASNKTIGHTYYTDAVRTAADAKERMIEVTEQDDAMHQIPEHLQHLIGKKETQQLVTACEHDKATVDLGRTIITSELHALGLKDVSAQYKFSNPQHLLYSASFVTPKGRRYIDVPVEVKQAMPMLPTVFIAKQGAFEFSKEGVQKFVQASEIADSNASEQIVASQRDSFYNDQSRGNGIGNALIEVIEGDTSATPKMAAPEALRDVESILLESVLRKQSKYTDLTISNGSKMIESELTDMGFPHTQVRFVGDSNSDLLYGATVQVGKHKADVVIPVEVRANQLCLASQFQLKTANTQYPFTTSGFGQLVKDSTEQLTPVKYSSAFIETDYNSLRKVIHAAANEGKYAIAEEALEVIKDKFGDTAHIKVVGEYQTWLSESSENVKTRCAGCAFYAAAGKRSVHAGDHCNLLSLACKDIRKDAATHVCTRKSVEWDKITDDSYKGVITTSQIAMT
jgi:hypothetical protein